MLQAVDGLTAIRRDPYVIAASLTANVLGLAVPIGMIQIYDRVIPNAAYATLAALGMGVAIALFFDFCLRLARAQLMAIAGARFEVAGYRAAMRCLLEEDHSRSEGVAPGKLLNQVLGVERLRAFHTGESAAAMLDLPFLVLFMVMIALISPVLAGTVMAMLSVAFLIIRVMRRRITVLNVARQENDGRRQSFMIETLRGIEVIRSLGIEDFMERRYDRLMSTSAPVSAALSSRIQVTQGITGAIGMLAPLVTAAAGAALVLQEQMTVGALAAVVLLTGRIVQPVLRIEALLVGEEDADRARAQLIDIARRPTLPSGHRGLLQVDEIALRDITWVPRDTQHPLFDRLSLTLQRGMCVAITGMEGSGRSSLLRIMAGQLIPDSGSILLNGVPVEEVRADHRRARVRLLSRQNHLLDGTLLDNLTAFRPHQNLDAAMELADALGLHGFIAQHAAGLSHRVGPGSQAGLPTSVVDSIMLVASLVSDPDVILFDEANVGLDQMADARLRDWLAGVKPHKLIVLVSHRPSYLSLADCTFRLERGRLRRASAAPVLNLSDNGIRVA